MTTTASAVAVATIAAAAISMAEPVLAQSADQRLGKVNFATSCKPAAQAQFDRAMLYQHSFWYRASQKAFEEALKADPDCAIAYWGTALSLLWNPHVAPPAKNLAEGAAALEKGKAMAAKTQRERDYLDTLSAMYADYEKVDHRTRVQNYLKAMERLAQRYPDDAERGDWKGAAQLELRPNPLAHVQAVTHFARALGAARSGNPEAAKTDIAKLAELRQQLRDKKDAYWGDQVDIQHQVATAWVQYAEGKHADALKSLGAAADAEDKTDKHPVTPGPLAPARELYGNMLLDRGMAKEALAAFEATLKKEPNRLGAYVGAARAAETSGNAAKAREYYAKVVELAAGADTVRTEVAEARAFMAKKR